MDRKLVLPPLGIVLLLTGCALVIFDTEGGCSQILRILKCLPILEYVSGIIKFLFGNMFFG